MCFPDSAHKRFNLLPAYASRYKKLQRFQKIIQYDQAVILCLFRIAVTGKAKRNTFSRFESTLLQLNGSIHLSGNWHCYRMFNYYRAISLSHMENFLKKLNHKTGLQKTEATKISPPANSVEEFQEAEEMR